MFKKINIIFIIVNIICNFSEFKKKGKYLNNCSLDIEKKLNNNDILFPKISLIFKNKNILELEEDDAQENYNFLDLNYKNLYHDFKEINTFEGILKIIEENKKKYNKLYNMINKTSNVLKFLFNLDENKKIFNQYIDFCNINSDSCVNNYDMLYLKRLFIENSDEDIFYYFKALILNQTFNKILKINKNTFNLKNLISIYNFKTDWKFKESNNYKKILTKFIKYYFDIDNYKLSTYDLKNKVNKENYDNLKINLNNEFKSLKDNFDNYINLELNIDNLK